MKDETYQDRYSDRTRVKAKKLLQSFDPSGKTCLDIGCNRGDFSDRLLQHPNCRVIGIDLVDVVSLTVRQNSRFKFLQQDIIELEEFPTADATFSLAVLHHVLGHYGWDTFEQVFERILNSAPVVFLEVGMPSENGSYYWKSRILERYATDQEWIEFLMSHSGIRYFSLIARLPIHNSHREILRIDTCHDESMGDRNEVYSGLSI